MQLIVTDTHLHVSVAHRPQTDTATQRKAIKHVHLPVAVRLTTADSDTVHKLLLCN